MKHLRMTLKLSILALLFVVFVTMYVYKYFHYRIIFPSSRAGCRVGNKGLSFKYLTHRARLCAPSANRTSVLIGVISSTHNFEARAAIRDTWGGTALKMGFDVVFLLGKTSDQEMQRKILSEHSLYGDIVQGDFVDSYRNLTYKTVMLIRWAREKCSEANFVLKIDDDILLGVWDFAVVVNGLIGVKRSMWGFLLRDAHPKRDVSSKWYMSREEYAPDTYPPYLAGAGYLISGDSIAALESITEDECFFPFEDVYLTGIIAERAQVNRSGLEGFSITHNLYQQPCSTPRVVISHNWSPESLRTQWKHVVSSLNFGLCIGINQTQMVV
ncbi:hypothetical protein HPB49_019497 [Dermacentor silvarum]|uniref:Uncharacterized protein n=1 Tax=Dermacentor silvarum TaxID=543639 RepID=A0ACB8DKF6_DERSI|nr:hypothetical protein HPB49_019497 [Dermacentor silvarum]